MKLKNKFAVGDKLELILPESNQNIIVENMKDMQEAAGGGYEVKIPLPNGCNHGLLSRYI